VRQFTEFLIDSRYGWGTACEDAFGTHPVAICHEWNTIAHLNDYEGDPEARPFTREELQRFLDYADEQVERAVKSRRKGALAAYCDATRAGRQTGLPQLLRPELGRALHPLRSRPRARRQGCRWVPALSQLPRQRRRQPGGMLRLRPLPESRRPPSRRTPWLPTAGQGPPLFTLAAELPAAILARVLGVHIQVAVQRQKASAGDWASYAAHVSRRRVPENQ
jgi:hypothetical protein